MRPGWRGIYVDNLLFAYAFDKKNILALDQLNTRSSRIIRKMVGKVGEVRNGLDLCTIDFQERFLYYRIGDFAFTRASVRQPRNRKKKKK